MPDDGNAPGAALPLQDVGSGPESPFDLKSRLTRLLSWLQLEGRVPVSLLYAKMMDCSLVSLDQLSGKVPA